VQLSVIAGGGIVNAATALAAFNAGADMVVVGNILERQPEVLNQIGAIL